MVKLEEFIREIPDFPKPGIMFKDITPLLASYEALTQAVESIASQLEGEAVDKVVGIESRGFLFGTPLAQKLKVGFVPVRKPNKLPAETVSETYELEYGTDKIEIHRDALREGEKVLIVDDLLATGGTAAAAVNLVKKLGAEVVACAFVIELSFLNGRQKLEPHKVISLITY